MSKYKIAFAAPLTGDQWVVGKPMYQMTRFILDKIKGDLDVEIVGYDDRAEYDVARKCAEEIVKDESILAVIHKNSDCMEAGSALYEAAKLPFITGSATNYGLSQKGFRCFRRFCANDRMQARIPVKFATERLGLKKFIVLHDGTTYGYPLGKEFKDYAEELGADVVDFVEIPVGTKEYGPIVNTIKNSGAEAVYMALTEIEGSLTASALHDAGVKIQLLGADANPSKLMEMAGPEATEGTYVTYAGYAIVPGSSAYEALKDFMREYDEIPVFSGELYDILTFLMKAIRSLDDPKRADMLEAIQHVEPFRGLTGSVEFNADGDRKTAEITLWHMKDGNMDYVDSFTAKDVGLD